MGPDDRVITKVEAEPRTKGRYRIDINGTYAFTVHEDVLVRFRLVKGASLPEELQREVMEEEERQAAYRAAIRYIGRAMRSAGEVRSKLESLGYAPEWIRHAIERLKEQGYVNDAAYAAALANQRLALNRKGRLWIRHELARKGIGKQEAERALAALDPREEWEQAWLLASKRWPSMKGDGTQRVRKVMILLLRRGFPAETARSVAMKLKEEHEIGGEFDLSDDHATGDEWD
jgi:regulatory protein